MGLFDGRVGREGFASTAHVARLTARPVVLVVDISAPSRTIGRGRARAARPTTRRADGRRGAQPGRLAAPRGRGRGARRSGVPVLGVLTATTGSATPSRHLGLVPAAERARTPSRWWRLADAVAEHVDLDAVLGSRARRRTWTRHAWDPATEIDARRPAGRWSPSPAGGRSRSATPRPRSCSRPPGCEVVAFDPLTDQRLPGGHRRRSTSVAASPRCTPRELADNAALRRDARARRSRPASRPWPSAPGCSTSAVARRRRPMVGVDRRGGGDDRAADAAATATRPRPPTTCCPGAGEPVHRPRVPPHRSHRPRTRTGRCVDGRRVPDAASPGRPCTRRTCTPTGPATPSSPSGSPRRAARHA